MQEDVDWFRVDEEARQIRVAKERAEYAAYTLAQENMHPHLRDDFNRAGNPALSFYEQMRLNGDWGR